MRGGMRQAIYIFSGDASDGRVAAIVDHLSEKTDVSTIDHADIHAPLVLAERRKLIVLLSNRLLADPSAIDFLDLMADRDVVFILTDTDRVPLGFAAPVLDWRSDEVSLRRRRLSWIEAWVHGMPPRMAFVGNTTEGLSERLQRSRVFAAYEPAFSMLSGTVGLMTIPFIAYAVVEVSRFRLAEDDDFFFGGLVNLSGLGLVTLFPLATVYLTEFASLALSKRRQYLPIALGYFWFWAVLRLILSIALAITIRISVGVGSNELENIETYGALPIYVMNGIVWATICYLLYALTLVLVRTVPLWQAHLNRNSVCSFGVVARDGATP